MNKIKLQFIWKRNKLQTWINTKIFDLKTWILINIIKDDCIEEYCIDVELLVDYYNEEPENSYMDDRD